MMQKREEHELIRRYLLGDLHEKQQDEIEEQLLTDEELQAQLLEAEDNLIDDYVSGALPEGEGKLFKRNFLLTPERLHKLRLSQALLNYAEVNVAKTQVVAEGLVSTTFWQKPWQFVQRYRLALAISATIILLLVGYGVWSTYRQWQAETYLAELRSQRAKVERDLAKLNAGQPAEPQGSIKTLDLNQLLIRDTGENRLAVITQGINILQLRLQLDEDKFSAYQAVVETDEGSGLYSVNNLMVKSIDGNKVIFLNLPGRLLPTGNYQIHVSGIIAGKEPVDIGIYPFQVVLR
jgi:type II secretory pathway component PulM